jgi:GrpB-like predicted nucleotidyltransferase (UPF0157 family)/8-oxo-dGTP pyrophosphatase MutT (NUDIX family)
MSGGPHRKERHLSIVDVHLLLLRDGRILFGRRQNTGYADGLLHLPSGHLEAGETAASAAAREALEELGITIDPAGLRLVHVMHRAPDTGPDRVGFFFLAERWTGDVRNNEPFLCSELVWAEPAALPTDVVAYPAAAIRATLLGEPYSEYAALGLQYGTVDVAAYRPEWTDLGVRFASAVASLLGPRSAAVEHIGSTSVPGLAAKPVIDLAVRLVPGFDHDDLVAVLTQAGWIYRGDAGGEGGLIFVSETQPWFRVAHIHAVAYDDPQFERYIEVRDRLRADPDAVARYAAVKAGLARRFPKDPKAYTAGKTDFIVALLASPSRREP